MIVKKPSKGVLVMPAALLCWSTLTMAGAPEPDTPAQGSVKTLPRAANVQPEDGASGATSKPDKGDAPPVTRSLVPDNAKPSVDPTQPWPRRGAVDESK